VFASVARELDLWLLWMFAVKHDGSADGLHMLDTGNPVGEKSPRLPGGQRCRLLNLELQKLARVESILDCLNGRFADPFLANLEDRFEMVRGGA